MHREPKPKQVLPCRTQVTLVVLVVQRKKEKLYNVCKSNKRQVCHFLLGPTRSRDEIWLRTWRMPSVRKRQEHREGDAVIDESREQHCCKINRLTNCEEQGL